MSCKLYSINDYKQFVRRPDFLMQLLNNAFLLEKHVTLDGIADALFAANVAAFRNRYPGRHEDTVTEAADGVQPLRITCLTTDSLNDAIDNITYQLTDCRDDDIRTIEMMQDIDMLRT